MQIRKFNEYYFQKMIDLSNYKPIPSLQTRLQEGIK